MRFHRRSIFAALLILSACGSSTQDNRSANASEQSAVEAQETTESEAEKFWVTAERINRYTCPSESCGIVGTLSFREAATVQERKGEWARVSRIYHASCVSGRSEFVDKGNAACVPENGIVDGRFGEWVQSNYLSATRPADPAESAAADEQLVKGSDDFTRYRRSFVKAARHLIDEGQCSAADFQEWGGFMKSTNYPGEPVYFAYCGGSTIANRIYVNAATGEIFR